MNVVTRSKCRIIRVVYTRSLKAAYIEANLLSLTSNSSNKQRKRFLIHIVYKAKKQVSNHINKKKNKENSPSTILLDVCSRYLVPPYAKPYSIKAIYRGALY